MFIFNRTFFPEKVAVPSIWIQYCGLLI